MIGHYVEDDELDAFSLVGLINGERNLALTTSRSLNNFQDWVQPQDVDFVLLDIHRPDARSMEKDVAKVRENSRAPIIFVTGDEATFYRDEAVAAGAQAVIEKDGLSPASLESVLKNIAADKPREANIETNEHLLVLHDVHDPVSAIDPAKVEGLFSYVRTILDALSSSDADAEAIKSTLTLVSSASASFKAYYAHEGQDSAQPARPRALPPIIRSIQEAALSAASQKSIKLAFQMGTEAIDGVEAIEKVQLGIRHFLHAAIVGSPQGSTVSFSASPTPGGMRLNVSSSAPFRFDGDNVFTKTLPPAPEQFNSTIAMTLAVMLLGLDKSDFSTFSRGSMHTITADYEG